MPRIDQLGELLRSERTRRGKSLRSAAADIGVSFNVLARVERGQLPDVDNYHRIIRWLGLSTAEFLDDQAETQPTSTIEAIAQHLRLDPHLTAESRDRIAAVVRDLYAALARPDGEVTVHLKAARTFKPAAAQLLADVLDEMRASLVRSSHR
jgi:transcriptional regulator with XRE-family HTH domain